MLKIIKVIIKSGVVFNQFSNVNKDDKHSNHKTLLFTLKSMLYIAYK